MKRSTVDGGVRWCNIGEILRRRTFPVEHFIFFHVFKSKRYLPVVTFQDVELTRTLTVIIWNEEVKCLIIVLFQDFIV